MISDEVIIKAARESGDLWTPDEELVRRFRAGEEAAAIEDARRARMRAERRKLREQPRSEGDVLFEVEGNVIELISKLRELNRLGLSSRLSVSLRLLRSVVEVALRERGPR